MRAWDDLQSLAGEVSHQRVGSRGAAKIRAGRHTSSDHVPISAAGRSGRAGNGHPQRAESVCGPGLLVGGVQRRQCARRRRSGLLDGAADRSVSDRRHGHRCSDRRGPATVLASTQSVERGHPVPVCLRLLRSRLAPHPGAYGARDYRECFGADQRRGYNDPGHDDPRSNPRTRRTCRVAGVRISLHAIAARPLRSGHRDGHVAGHREKRGLGRYG